ncbi:Hermansky-Pudlak syndrome 1 protein homolog [Culex quinquefasciatus]|uniref:Hermansky-Pudlak syndrome 1 protein homolog n=1 Tax=Culex quinquefasciatus TaxID=7176 RepID=UPI0018E35D64|nr:Hermansky-Pudlak syndrome 1 protein homolog [Culex quinquefasciatus]
MEGVLIFDQSNDLIYQNFNDAMRAKMSRHAIDLGLMEDDKRDSRKDLDANVLIQIFSPLVASQRIMMCQFDNAYTSVQMENNLNLVFDEFLGYLFIEISNKEVDQVRREIGVCICLLKHICGPNLHIIKNDTKMSLLLTNLITTYRRLYKANQGILVEAIEQLLVNADVKNTVVSALQGATEKLKQDPHSQRSHSIMFVGNKFLSLYSSKQAQELSPADMLFLNIFCQTLDRGEHSKRIESHVVFLQGCVGQTTSGCIPHIVHVSKLFDDVFLVLLIEHGNIALSGNLYDVFFALQKIQNMQMQMDVENLRPAFDSLETYVKHTMDSLKKLKHNTTEADEAVRNFTLRWENLRKRYVEYFKNSDGALIVTIESNMPMFVDAVKEVFKLLCAECSTLEHGLQRVSDIADMVEGRLTEVFNFLQVKSQKNFSMGSYLEDFPGLVHFIHIDRNNGRIVAPGLDHEHPDDVLKERIWSMVELSRTYLHKGHTSMIWKDTTFSYGYFLWFEDVNGTALNPKELPDSTTSSSKPSLIAGILAGDYYHRMIEQGFPRSAPSKIRCYELFCVHIGLVTPTNVLEHCRRLSVTINDVTGCVGNPIDLL